MSLGDQFQVTLPSNVKGHANNHHGQYETTLATPLELNGDWEVALIDITYPHTWYNLNKEYHMTILAVPLEDEPDYRKQHFQGGPKTAELVRGMDLVESTAHQMDDTVQFKRYVTRNAFTIIPGQYDIDSLLLKIQAELRLAGLGLSRATLTYNKERNRVLISNLSRAAILACYENNSLLRLLGFNNMILNNNKFFARYMGDGDAHAYEDIDYIKLPMSESIEADLPPQVLPIGSIFVYSDIAEYVLVGDTQTPMLGYLPVQSKWGERSYWNFNPAYYIRVKERNIRTICIKLCDDRGTVIEFKGDGSVICRLHFRRLR